jgi:hypothetical protein
VLQLGTLHPSFSRQNPLDTPGNSHSVSLLAPAGPTWPRPSKALGRDEGRPLLLLRLPSRHPCSLSYLQTLGEGGCLSGRTGCCCCPTCCFPNVCCPLLLFLRLHSQPRLCWCPTPCLPAPVPVLLLPPPLLPCRCCCLRGHLCCRPLLRFLLLLACLPCCSSAQPFQ